MNLKKKDKFLFIGDSITDCGRNAHHAFHLGQGYVNYVAGYLGITFPDQGFEVINRGVAGNVLADLVERWEEDCLSLEADWVTILIGVNDVWRRMDQGLEPNPAHFQQFKERYEYLIQSLVQRGKSREIILMTAFAKPTDQVERWEEYLQGINQQVYDLAATYDLVCVPLDQIVPSYAQSHPQTAFFQDDGVHLTAAGHGVIAKAWLTLSGLKKD